MLMELMDKELRWRQCLRRGHKPYSYPQGIACRHCGLALPGA